MLRLFLNVRVPVGVAEACCKYGLVITGVRCLEASTEADRHDLPGPVPRKRSVAGGPPGWPIDGKARQRLGARQPGCYLDRLQPKSIDWRVRHGRPHPTKCVDGARFAGTLLG